MDVIHFTAAATALLNAFGSAAASFIPLAGGQGNSHISCLHLKRRGKIQAPSIAHSAALLCVHGCLSVKTPFPETQVNIHAGMGAVLDKDEPYSLTSEEGAIVLIVESDEMAASERAISTPQRIAGASWPSDSLIAAR